jgi:hypothetical protein
MGHWNAGGLGSESLFFLTLAALGLILVALLIFSCRHGEPARADAQEAVYENMDGQINSLLLQAGGPLSQDAIRDSLKVPVTAVARTLEAMEKRGDLRREWQPGEYTYLVYRT